MKVEDLFSKLNNCNCRYLDVSDNKQVRGILDVLYREGSIRYYQRVVKRSGNFKTNPSHLFLRVFLKSQLTQAVRLPTRIKRSPAVKYRKLIGNTIISTSSLGICTGKEARQAKIGGTVLGKL